MQTTTSLEFATRNTLAEHLRHQIAGALNEKLASLIDLCSQIKQAHWNGRGPNFISVHEMLDEVHEDVMTYTDTVAERIVQIGGLARGTLQAAVSSTRLDAFPSRPMPYQEILGILCTALSKMADETRKGADWCEELGDIATVDILTEISRGLDTWLWKLEAHLD